MKDFHIVLIDIEDAWKGFLGNLCTELQKRERLEQYVIKVIDNECKKYDKCDQLRMSFMKF